MRSRTALLMLSLSVLLLGRSSSIPAGEIRPRIQVRENPYFPLHVGDRWVYQHVDHLTIDPNPGSPIRAMTFVSVTDSVAAADGYTYFSLESFFTPADPPGTRRLVRAPLGGSVLEMDEGGGPSHLWYMLQAPVGTTWTLTQDDPADPCLSGARIRVASRIDSVKVPAGDFRNVVRLEVEENCADDGITAEWYAPGVGLVKRRRSGLAGFVDQELWWASLRDRQFPGRAYTSTLILDRPLYANDLFPVIGPPPGPGGIAVVHAALVLGNGSDVPATFEFDGCKSATFRILDPAGIEVLKVRGDDGGCCGCGETTSFTLRQNTLVLRAGIRLALPDGTRLPDGNYVVVAELDAINLEPPLRPAARAPIQVVTLQ